MSRAEQDAVVGSAPEPSAAEHTAADTAADLMLARQVADSVLYEGYVLFPYRASARKNQFRWQFGVVCPPDHVDERGCEPSAMAAELLLVGGAHTEVEVRARFLRVRHRDVQARDERGAHHSVPQLEAGGQALVAWDEGVECEWCDGARLSDLLAGGLEVPLDLPGDQQTEEFSGAAGHPPVGRVVRTLAPLAGALRLRAEALDHRQGLVKLRVEVCNRTAGAGASASRDEILRRSLVGLHLLVSVGDGAFLSAQDPPEWARACADALTNRHLYPVLIGRPGSDAVMLASPIILYDHPEIAPESPGDTFDATEIDELLSLSITCLTGEERREARATDPRAAEIIDRVDDLGAAWQERLHGSVRQPVGPRRAGPGGAATGDAAPGGDAAAGDAFAEFFGVGEPPTERLSVGDGEIVVGARVRLDPMRRADAQDFFVEGRTARVQRIVTDVDGSTHVGVSLEDDPGADLHAWHGRFLYFHPDEVVPLGAT